ncbi:hypothetical protein Gorai_008131 [Gossypium raimondii]|uniref:Uncharacterized protein n=1 Tax=Gossypium raimondii TaxID=29730 RepID=A0A7J8Q9U5_GOSRA|nr:hypothetical protein [Gossypium raimondii]
MESRNVLVSRLQNVRKQTMNTLIHWR